MSGYEYGNARLRAMKSRLLSRREMDALVEAGSIQGLIAALTGTAYRRSIEAALTRASGLACISEALHWDLIHTLGKVRAFYSDQAGEMVVVALRSYDLHNLKAILRGLSKNVAFGEILSVLAPIGELKDHVLAELASASNPRAAIDLMASMGLPFARPLLELRIEQPGADIPAMELALERWFFCEAYNYLQRERGNGGPLLPAIQLEADLANLLTVLRFVHSPEERKVLREWLHSDDLNLLFVGPGKLPFELLELAGNQDTINAAVETLSGTPYGPSLRTGLQAYARSMLLSEFEKQFKRLRLAWMSGQITRDPLGIGVLLGYSALKTSEVGNVRWIAHGFDLGLGKDAIRVELEYPP
ncbi:MAG: V-type ATPase subunit [Anaerolineales bacterium]|nr:V-type ATPase subunit [Anaerolineales bacterium]